MRVKAESAKTGLHLNIVNTEKIYNFNLDKKDIEIVQDFACLRSIINSNEDCSQEIKRKLKLRRAAMEELALETKAKIIHTLVYPITMYRCESWTVKKADRKIIDSFEIWCWKRVYRYPGQPER